MRIRLTKPKAARPHKVTHPVIGVATWAEIQKAAGALRETGRKPCSWCHAEVPPGRRTQCGKPECEQAIHRAHSWTYCRALVLHAAKRRCALCKGHASEVDHITPVSLGGTGDADNLRALCTTCHLAESRRLAREKKGFRASVSGAGEVRA